MDIPSKILVVDDDAMLCMFVVDALTIKGFTILAAQNVQEAKRVIQKETVDLLISDIQMMGGSGIDLLRYMHAEFPLVPTIIMTGFPGEEYIKIIEEMEADAFLIKPFSTNQIRYTALKALEKRKRAMESHTIGSQPGADDDLGLIGVSEYIVKLRRKIRDVARGDFPVLIQGPSGSGKEIIAHAIHSCSARGVNPIVTINCAAIPKDLEESEFFGHTKGAFTGAHRDNSGIIAVADNSTLFLDEIGELTLNVQAKMLRVIENGEFLRIGETTSRKVNIRVITATNRDLKEMIAEKAFREDLYFRLGIMLHTKPLCEHREDIPVLVRHLVSKSFTDNQHRPTQITAEAMAFLVDFPWPGNIRQLKQTVNMLCHSAAGKKRINLDDLRCIMEHKPQNSNDSSGSYLDEKTRMVQEFEFGYFSKLLKQYSGNISQAAKASGMYRPNLIKKLKSLGICADSYRE